jgi:hypothetical protein
MYSCIELTCQYVPQYQVVGVYYHSVVGGHVLEKEQDKTNEKGKDNSFEARD